MARLEGQLDLLESRLPVCLEEMQNALRPFVLRTIGLRRGFVVWLGEVLHRPRLSRYIRAQIVALAECVSRQTEIQYGVSLEAEITSLRGAENQDDAESIQAKEILDELELRFPNPTDDHGERPTYAWHPPEPGKPALPTAPGADPEKLKRRLFLGLAREFHPDKVLGDEARRARTQLMQSLNQAFQGGDLRTMLELMHLHGSANAHAGLDADSMAELVKAMVAQRIQLQQSIGTLLEPLPRIQGGWLRAIENPEEWGRVLKRELSLASRTETHFDGLVRALSKPGELEAFLLETVEADWLEMF